MASTHQAGGPSVVEAPKSAFLTPFGREICISEIKGSALYRINYADGKGGDLPERYSGRYTKTEYAAEDARLLIKELWAAYTQAQQALVEDVVEAEVKRRGRPPKTVASVE